MANLLYKDESLRIVGACFEVYNQTVRIYRTLYQECLAFEFAIQGIPHVAQPRFTLAIKETP